MTSEAPYPPAGEAEKPNVLLASAARVADDGGLTIRSRRSERHRKKLERKLITSRASGEARTLLDLPYELVIGILGLLRPQDLFRLSRVSRTMHEFMFSEEDILSRRVIGWRYPSLGKCLRLPVLLADVDASLHPYLQSEERMELRMMREKPYQHVRQPDPALTCTCLTCNLRWNSLCLVVDFAHWQSHLDKGEPLPAIPRGRKPAWNEDLLDEHTAVVTKALFSPLWHASILEAHLASTTRSIRRHAENKGNRRRRFRMTIEDVATDTDAFLERSGPPTVDFPFHRDNYYMLEAYMPGRGWSAEEGRWRYMPLEQHATDVLLVERWVKWKQAKAAAEKAAEEEEAAAKEKRDSQRAANETLSRED